MFREYYDFVKSMLIFTKVTQPGQYAQGRLGVHHEGDITGGQGAEDKAGTA